MPTNRNAIWTVEHVDFLASLDKQFLTTQEMAVAMSKHFKMRVTVNHVSRLLARMRASHDVFYRNIPYRAAAPRRSY